MDSVHVQNIDKYYANNHVLKDLTMKIDPGEFMVLLGPSGCGKSTLLNCIAGLEEVDSGRIYIGDRDVTYDEPKDRGIAMVFQSYALYPTMTVEGNMSFSLKMARVPKDEVKKRVSEVADMLHISPLLKRKPAQLSGGQRQRVAIGRALVRDAMVFLFDEPLSNLDAKLRTEMRAELKRLHDRLGHTTIYVTHDQVEAMTMATQIAVMRDGIVQQVSDPQTIYDKPETLFVASFIGSPGMNHLQGTINMKDGIIGAQVGDYFLSLDRYAFRGAVEEGKQVILGVRPENIKRIDEAEGGAGVRLLSDVIEPLGSDTLVLFDFAGNNFIVRLSPQDAQDIRPHEWVNLEIDVSKASVFDLETDQRL